MSRARCLETCMRIWKCWNACFMESITFADHVRNTCIGGWYDARSGVGWVAAMRGPNRAGEFRRCPERTDRTARRERRRRHAASLSLPSVSTRPVKASGARRPVSIAVRSCVVIVGRTCASAGELTREPWVQCSLVKLCVLPVQLTAATEQVCVVSNWGCASCNFAPCLRDALLRSYVRSSTKSLLKSFKCAPGPRRPRAWNFTPRTNNYLHIETTEYFRKNCSRKYHWPCSPESS